MPALVQVQPMRNLSQENMAERDNSHCPLSFTLAFEYVNTGPQVHTCVYTHIHKSHIVISHTCMNMYEHTPHANVHIPHISAYIISHTKQTNKDTQLKFYAVPI